MLLIVEDDEWVLKLAESILRAAGYETVSVSTVAGAQTVILSDQKVALVFTDMALGDDPEGGIAVGQAAAHHRAATPVLYTSGRPVTEQMRSQFVGPNNFLPKPYKRRDLLRAVNDLLGTEPLMS